MRNCRRCMYLYVCLYVCVQVGISSHGPWVFWNIHFGLNVKPSASLGLSRSFSFITINSTIISDCLDCHSFYSARFALYALSAYSTLRQQQQFTASSC